MYTLCLGISKLPRWHIQFATNSLIKVCCLRIEAQAKLVPKEGASLGGQFALGDMPRKEGGDMNWGAGL